MNGPDLLERTRMALAEAGYPDARVSMDGTELKVTRFSPTQTAVVPTEDVWRAFSVAGVMAKCRDCFMGLTTDSCLADRPLVHDCGITR